MNEDKIEDLVNLWYEEVFNNAEEIDPSDQYCWESLLVGWCLSKNLTMDEALEFRDYVDF